MAEYLTDEERDALRDWWDEETTVSVESAFPVIARIVRDHMAQAWDEGMEIGSDHTFPEDLCWQWDEERQTYVADLPNPYRPSELSQSPGATSPNGGAV